MYFDTHAHYDDGKFDADRDGVLSSLPEKGVELVMNAACDLPTVKSSVALAEKYPFVYAAVGIHPHDADTLDDAALALIESCCRHEKVKAIGEIGLDYHYDLSPRDVQKKAFRAQLELARALDMPVIVHDREAHEDCLAIVREFRGVTGVFHCFSGSAELAEELVRLGWYISFTGAVTFKNAKKAPGIVASLPEDRIMLETDCPYMTPEPFRGKRNDSSYLEYICAAVASFRGISPERAAAVTAENGRRFFSI
ncbi:MAG: TatD family hydrolase [Oscillospiraceae bacterium]|jgi:TatD DNase family protein|nr:TatD family hydrolase [Oscillospiraceae bacterium]